MPLTPPSLAGYQRSWLSRDVIAGVTLAAIAIPEVLGYTSISQTPLATGLYTVIFPTVVFALLGSSRLLVVGADSATAAILAAGLAGLGIAGLQPYTPEWVAWCSLAALVCGALLLLANVLKLGFIGDFLSTSVLVGFLTGVGIQVLSGQIPDMLGVPKGSGNWFEQQVEMLRSIPDLNVGTTAYAVATVGIILVCDRFFPRIPGAILAVVGSIIVSTALGSADHGVDVVGPVTGGFPPVGLPTGINLADAWKVLAVAGSCFVLIIAQSAATSRSFAAKHGDRVNINRDLLGLSGANLAAGLTGTFVVNGSPTKTQIVDGQRARTQVANRTMSVIVLAFTLFFTSMLTTMPKAVLAGIVFMIGVSLVDLAGLSVIRRKRLSEFVIACVTGFVVFAVGVEQGIVLAIIVSILEVVRRAYQPASFVIQQDVEDNPRYLRAAEGAQSLPGLVVFRFDAELFYANASRFTDSVEAVMRSAPSPVRWLVLDCSSLDDVDYSAGVALCSLVDYVHAHDAKFGLTRADDGLLETLRGYGLLDKFSPTQVFATLEEAFDAYRADVPAST